MDVGLISGYPTVSGSTPSAPFQIDTFSRNVRASPQEFSATIDRLAIVARLIKSITLLNGIFDETIPYDRALADILNVALLDFEKLKTFDKQKVETFLPTFAQLSGSMSSSTTTLELEKSIILFFNWMQKFEDVGDVTDTKLGKEYFTAVGKLGSKVLEENFFKTAAENIDEYSLSLKKVRDAPATINGQSYLPNMITLTSASEFVENFGKDLTKWIDSLRQFDDLTKSEFLLYSPQSALMHLLSDVAAAKSSILQIGQTEESELVALAAALQNSLSTAPIADLINLGEVASSQSQMKPVSSPKYTSGFLHGPSDLEKLDSDAVDAAITPLLSDFNQKTLQSELAPWKSLNGGIAELQQAWASLKAPKTVKTGGRLYLLTKHLEAAKTELTAEVLKKVTSHGRTMPPTDPAFGVLLKKSIDLRATLLSSRQMAEALQNSSEVQGLTQFSEMKNYLPTAIITNASSVPTHVTKFKAYNKISELVQTLDDLKTKVTAISLNLATVKVIQTISDLSNGQQEMDNFVADKAAVTYFEDFKNLSSDVQSVSNTVHLIQQIRNFPTDPSFVQELSTIADTLLASVPKITSLLNATSTIKTNGAVGSELKKLNLSMSSKNLGDSVALLDNVRKIIESKNELRALLQNGNNVQGALSVVQDLPKRQKLLSAWGNFSEVPTKVEAWITEFENRRDSIAASIGNVTKFADFENVFESFAGLQNLDLEMEKRQQVLEELSPNFQNLSMALSVLQSFNFQFSRSASELSKISETLADLDFAFYNAVYGTTPQAVVSSTSSGSDTSPQTGNTQAMKDSTTTESDSTEMYVLALLGVTAGISLSGLAGYAGWKMYKKKKFEGKKDGGVESGENPKKGKKTQKSKSDEKASTSTDEMPHAEDMENPKGLELIEPPPAPEAVQPPPPAQSLTVRQRIIKGLRRLLPRKPQQPPAPPALLPVSKLDGVASLEPLSPVAPSLGAPTPRASSPAAPSPVVQEPQPPPSPIENPAAPPVANRAQRARASSAPAVLHRQQRSPSRRPRRRVEPGVPVPNEDEVEDYNFKHSWIYKDHFSRQLESLSIVRNEPSVRREPRRFEAGDILPHQRPLLIGPDDRSIRACVYRPRCGRYLLFLAPTKTNIVTFFETLFLQDIHNIIMACQPDEDFPFYSLNPGTVLAHGAFDVEVASVDLHQDFGGELSTIELIVTDTVERETRRFTMFQFPLWARGVVHDATNPDHANFCKAYDYTHEKTQHMMDHVAVFSADSTARAHMFVGSQLYFQDLLHPSTTISMLLEYEHMQMAWGEDAIENGKQYLFIALTTLRWIRNTGRFEEANTAEFLEMMRWCWECVSTDPPPHLNIATNSVVGISRYVGEFIKQPWFVPQNEARDELRYHLRYESDERISVRSFNKTGPLPLA